MRIPLFAQIALLLAALLGLAWFAWPDGRLHVYFLDTAGDAALIRTPAGDFVLLDGGADPAALAAAIGQHMPFWQRSLRAVVLTATDSQHVPGQVAALERYRAGLALAPPSPRRGALLDAWLALLDEGGTTVRTARHGSRLDLGGATLQVLAVGEGKAAGTVLRLDYGTTSVVLAHTASESVERALLSAGTLRPTSVLVYPWERDPNTPFVAALRPGAIVFADGQAADSPAELTFVERAVGSAALYHERLHGTVEWISDGGRWSIATHR